MKQKSSILLFVLSFILTMNAWAQQTGHRPIQCGSSPSKEMMVKYREQGKAERSFVQTRDGSVFNFPIVFHILRRTNGTGGISAEDVSREMNWANEKYDGAGIEFFQCSPPEFINDDNLFYTTFDHDWEDFCGQTTAEYEIAGDHNVSNVINIYYVNTDGWNWGAFPSALDDCRDWIIMDIADTGSNYLLAHELGHYFNLLHTFQGYDGSNADFENITRDDDFPFCNCSTAGDLLCDTEADPNGWSGCAWDGSGTDNCTNNDYNPDEKNIMSYANGCQEYFTAGQIGRIQYAALFLRNYLNCPFLSTCQASWNLSNTQTSMFSYQATDFIKSTATINPGVTSAYDASNYVLLKAGFYAKEGCDFHVVPEGCWGPVVFKTDDETHPDIKNDEVITRSYKLYPNPAGDFTHIVFTGEGDAYSITIHSALGQTVFQQSFTEAKTQRDVLLDLSTFQKGIYFVTLNTELDSETISLVVQ